MKNQKPTSTIGRRLPTATVTPVRLCVFQATRRPQQMVRAVQTAFGSVSVDGRLGQQHADLLECVMFHSMRHQVVDGRLGVLVDPHRVRVAMGGGGSKYSGSRVKDFERDLLRSILSIDSPTVAIRGHIVEKVVETKTTVHDPRRWGGSGERPLQLWVFSQEWTRLVAADIGRFYDPTPFCQIEHGSVAAIARHVLTHRHQPNGGWKLEGLMQAVGVERRPDKVRAELQLNEKELALLGITLDGDRLKMSAPAPTMSAPAPSEVDFVRTGPSF